ncbi:MAG: pyridoxamine 5'-phosphate oxidase family protein, partial [Chitinophagia bacterium]|nr:pyridoxamine 5'-phosphate oxidase family protein [Chitinophagia bacterium]
MTMGKFSDQILQHHETFIYEQHMFFVATAPQASNGHINLSPKGLPGSFKVLSPTQVAYLDIV